MMKTLFLLLFLPVSLFAQERVVHFTLAQSNDEDCISEFAVNGMYTIQASAVPRLKIPGAVLVTPYSLLDSANLLLGRQGQYSVLASHSYSRNEFREVFEYEAIQCLRAQGKIVSSSLHDYDAKELERFGLFKISYPDSIQTESIVHYYTDENGVGFGVVDGVYLPTYLLRDSTEELLLHSDSLQAEWLKVRQSLQGEVQALTAPFYLSKNEVTNREYREFVNWVKDSLAREILYRNLDDDDEAFALLDYQKRWKERYSKELKAFIKDTAVSYYQDPPYYLDVDHSAREKNREICYFDREVKLDYDDPKIREVLSIGGFFFPHNERYYYRREVDFRNLNYSFNGTELNIYPDTSAFIQLMEDAPHLNYGLHYFWHPYFDDYPVMGVSRDQALAYCHWKEKQIQSTLPGAENIRVALPELVHYEWALKSILPIHSRPFAASLESNFLFDYARTINEASSVFLNPVGTKRMTLKTQMERMKNLRGSKDLIIDERQIEYQVSSFNQWSGDYPDAVFQDLFGNVSEWTNTPADDAYYFVLGANYKQAVKTLGENRFNALFYRQKMYSKQSSALVGFRLVYSVSTSQIPRR